MSSLTQVVAGLRTSHVGLPPVTVKAFDIGTLGPAGTLKVPAFVYRGEANAAWDSLKSSMQWLRENPKLSCWDKRRIIRLTRTIDSEIQAQFNLSRPLSAGLLQHYGLPTELIDVSPSLETAAFFAGYGNTSRTGSITVIPTNRLSGQTMIMDLQVLDFAPRPVSQAGYGVFHRSLTNLLSAGFVAAVKPVKHTFDVSSADIATFVQGQPKLLSAYHDDQDPARAVVTSFIDRYVERKGPLSAKAATWLAQRIPPTALTIANMAVAGTNADITLGTRKNAAHPYDAAQQIDLNRRRWAGLP